MLHHGPWIGEPPLKVVKHFGQAPQGTGTILFCKFMKYHPTIYSQIFASFFVFPHVILYVTFPPDLKFVATVATGGRVKFVPGVKIFPENNAISRIISVELKDLPTPSVILH